MVVVEEEEKVGEEEEEKEDDILMLSDMSGFIPEGEKENKLGFHQRYFSFGRSAFY